MSSPSLYFAAGFEDTVGAETLGLFTNTTKWGKKCDDFYELLRFPNLAKTSKNKRLLELCRAENSND